MHLWHRGNTVRGRFRALSLLLSLAALSAASGCARSDAAAPPDVPAEAVTPADDGVIHIKEASRPYITVEEVSATTTDAMVSAPAHVDFGDGALAQIGAPLEGRVTAVHVHVGQSVGPGDSLVTIDCPDAAGLRAASDVARASLREARLELDRQRRMRDEGVGIERELVAAETRVSSAEAEAARAESGVSSIGPGAAAAVVIRAPIGGIVISRKASVGMSVQRGGDPLVEIGNAAALRIVADVFERDLPRVRIGARAQMTFPSLHDAMEGRVATIGTVVAPGLRTTPIFLSSDHLGSSMHPGMYGRVDIETADAVMTLPVTAVLIKDGKGPIVYVEKTPLTYLRRSVVLAQPVEGRVQIVSGLMPGERVVVRGALLLDGAADQLL